MLRSTKPTKVYPAFIPYFVYLSSPCYYSLLESQLLPTCPYSLQLIQDLEEEGWLSDIFFF